MRLKLVVAVPILAALSYAMPLVSQIAPDNVPITIHVGSELLVRDDFQGMPTDMEIVGNRIVVVDAMAEKPVVVFDLEGKLIARHLPEGDGPKEARRVVTVAGVADTAYAWDVGRSRVVRFGVDELPADASYEADILPGVVARSSVPIDSGYLLATGVDGLFVRWRGETEADTLGESPPVLKSVDKEARRGNRAIRVLAVHPTKPLVAIAFMGTGEFLVADLDGNPISDVVRHMEWKVNTKDPSALPRMVTYVNLAVTDSAVFALFVGKPLEEASIESTVDARQVLIYDWAGDLQRIVEIDHPAFDIAVRDGFLYTLHPAPIPELRRYHLPDDAYR